MAGKSKGSPTGDTSVGKRNRKRRLSVAASVLLDEEPDHSDPEYEPCKQTLNYRAKKAARAEAPREASFLSRLTCQQHWPSFGQVHCCSTTRDTLCHAGMMTHTRCRDQ